MARINVLILINLAILAVQAFSVSEKGKLLTPEQGCGVSDKIPMPRIVGGTTAKPGAYPWMALLGYGPYSGGSSYNCGGSLISSRHVLTAAHCINSDLYKVRLGEHDIISNDDGPVQDIKIVKIDLHVKYNASRANYDIAVLTLERDVEFSDRIKPICLPKDQPARSQNFIGSQTFIAGWGRLAESGRGSTVLQQLQHPVLANTHCEKMFPYFENDTQICAGNLKGGDGSCYGDSGGPLMLPLSVNRTFPFYQIGVVSYGGGCARENIPVVFTGVQHFIDWIQSKIN